MKIQINSYEPKMAADGSGPDSFIYQEKTLYPYIVSFTIDGKQFQGEANVRNTPPWWEIGQSYDVTIENSDRYVGGNKISFPRRHTGGMPFNSPTQTTQPNYATPTSSAPQNNPAPASTTRSYASSINDSFRQSLIVAQSSIKAAVDYVTSITDAERIELQKSLGTEDDLISKYAMKIATEVYKIAQEFANPR